MPVHTKEPRTNTRCTLAFVGPAQHADAARQALRALGFEETRDEEQPDTVPWREAFEHWSDAALPGHALAGSRRNAGVTQLQLARVTGIPQRHISEMEHGKRSIGKERARKLAAALKVDYHIFL